MLTGSERDAAVHQRMEEERSHSAQLEEERRYVLQTLWMIA